MLKVCICVKYNELYIYNNFFLTENLFKYLDP